MQLILNKDAINKKNNKIKNTIAIISSREWLREETAEKVRLADINDIKSFDESIFLVPKINLSDKTIGAIIDIGSNDNIEKTLDLIKILIPRDCWCVLVGDIDSIGIAQQFIQRGILYLNIKSQLSELTQHLLKGIPIESERKAFFISILGCKGGIGTTLISYHLATAITQIKQSPTLLLQGNNGSQDLDLVTEKKMVTEITEYQNNLSLMFGKGQDIAEIDGHRDIKHNFIVFDQPIHNVPKEKLTDYIEHANCIIVLLDNSMMSVRVAKTFIVIYEKFKRDNRQATRLLVCLNESRPITRDMLDTSDIPSLLGRKIDIRIPFIHKTTESLSDKNYFGRKKTIITELAKYTLGITIDLSNKRKSWLRKLLKGKN
ncbi:pilus assembly protein CpaE [Yersinia sp. 2545 StPb PI]|uniref:pilus assembly protein CpaE n=1 Tax=Yersinia sp. 2545 StPb PI TaxID=3117410 RepID=UPI003FA4AF52